MMSMEGASGVSTSTTTVQVKYLQGVMDLVAELLWGSEASQGEDGARFCYGVLPAAERFVIFWQQWRLEVWEYGWQWSSEWCAGRGHWTVRRS